MKEVKLGELVAGESFRDAVHVAVVTMTATKVLQPGEHLANGIVDPYLKEPVQTGQRYLLCLYPGTVTSLRHTWAHPSFPDAPVLPPKARSEADAWREHFVRAREEAAENGYYGDRGEEVLG